jgi:hypothetical protein
MLNERDTPETDESGATMSPQQVRILKIAIAIMSVLLVVGFILLLVGIYYQSTRSPSADPRAAIQRQLDAPVPLVNLPMKPGMQVNNVLVDQGRLIVHMRGQGGDEIVIIDLASGWQQQRITIAPPQ